MPDHSGEIQGALSGQVVNPGTVLWSALVSVRGSPKSLPDDVERALSLLVTTPRAPEAPATIELLRHLLEFKTRVDVKRIGSPAAYLFIQQAVWSYLNSAREWRDFERLCRAPAIRDACAVELCDLFHRDAEPIMKSLRAADIRSNREALRLAERAGLIGSFIGKSTAGMPDYVERLRSLWQDWGIDSEKKFSPDGVKGFWWGFIGGAAKALQGSPERGLVMEVCNLARVMYSLEQLDPALRNTRAYLSGLWSTQELVASCIIREMDLGLQPAFQLRGTYPSLAEVVISAAPVLRNRWRHQMHPSTPHHQEAAAGGLGIGAAWQAIQIAHHVRRPLEIRLAADLFMGYLLEGDAVHQLRDFAKSRHYEPFKKESKVLAELLREEVRKAKGIYRDTLFTKRVMGALDLLAVLGVEGSAAVPDLCSLFGDAVVEYLPRRYFRIPFVHGRREQRPEVLEAAFGTLACILARIDSYTVASRLEFYGLIIRPTAIEKTSKNDRPTSSSPSTEDL